MRVKVRKIYDKYGMFSILIYRMANGYAQLCTVRVSVWDGQAEKALIYREKRKTDCFYPHDVNSCE